MEISHHLWSFHQMTTSFSKRKVLENSRTELCCRKKTRRMKRVIFVIRIAVFNSKPNSIVIQNKLDNWTVFQDTKEVRFQQVWFNNRLIIVYKLNVIFCMFHKVWLYLRPANLNPLLSAYQRRDDHKFNVSCINGTVSISNRPILSN